MEFVELIVEFCDSSWSQGGLVHARTPMQDMVPGTRKYQQMCRQASNPAQDLGNTRQEELSQLIQALLTGMCSQSLQMLGAGADHLTT